MVHLVPEAAERPEAAGPSDSSQGLTSRTYALPPFSRLFNQMVLVLVLVLSCVSQEQAHFTAEELAALRPGMMLQFQ